MAPIVLQTDCPDLTLWHRGKVRDMYDLDDRLLMVATDRVSAYDVVMPNGIPDKGRVLTAISKFWFDYTKNLAPNHVITDDIDEMPSEVQTCRETLEGRAMLVKKTARVDIECVVRGYISGSAWREYKGSGTVCGVALPSGLQESGRFPEPIFTPATKAASGHDENISVEQMTEIVGEDLTNRLRKLSISLYEAAAQYAAERGIIIADTKFEFGLRDGEIILIDEALTPDSSRFWPADEHEPGRPQRSFDKQFLRDYLDTLDWDKTPPAPQLPREVIEGTSRRYREAYERLVGKSFE